MMNYRRLLSTSVVCAMALLLNGNTFSQQPSPAQMVVVQAAAGPGVPAPAKPAAAVAPNSPSLTDAIKALQQVKASNEETLKKQAATLEQLDELQKAAEQLKIFSKRV
jgi:hypothetical protein